VASLESEAIDGAMGIGINARDGYVIGDMNPFSDATEWESKK
jgi:hypothetical protein